MFGGFKIDPITGAQVKHEAVLVRWAPGGRDARHTSGTLLGEQYVDLHVIQRILGHAQVSTTRIYTDPTDPLTREAVGRIGNVLWPDAGQPQLRTQPPVANSYGEVGETPGQNGCAARDSNPEPAD